MRPAVVAMIGSAGLSILMLALFDSSMFSARLENLHIIELILFTCSLFLLRRYRERVGAIRIILGSGVAGTIMVLAANAMGF